MKKLLILIVALLPLLLAAASQQTPRYAVAISPTPVLNTPAFAKVFSGAQKLDPCKGVRPIEFIALPGTLFSIEGEQVKDGVTVYRVTSNDYPYRTTSGYFVDARFLKPVEGTPEERPRALPELALVQQRLLAALGKPYVWGGNVKDGVALLRQLYPKGDPLAGVDCSGLLYEATDGFTPRNTSALTTFGEAVPVAGLSSVRIAQRLQPLDLIVWKGHVMIVLDRDSFIESVMGCEGGGSGVRLTPLRDGLRRIMKSRQPMDEFPQAAAGAKGFVVRRWFSH
jgi:hypothetical protein